VSSSSENRRDRAGPLSLGGVTPRRALILLSALAGIGGLYAGASGYVRELLLKRLVQELVDQAMNARVAESGPISLSPEGALVLHRPKLVTRHGERDVELFEAKSIGFTLNGDAAWVLGRAFSRAEDLRLYRIDVDRPRLTFARGPDGQWNIDTAFRPRGYPQGPTAAPPPRGPVPAPPDYFPAQGIHVTSADLRVEFINPTRTVGWEIQELSFSVRKTPGGQVQFRGEDGGETVAGRFYGGTIHISLDVAGWAPFLRGQIRIRAFDTRLEELTRTMSLSRPVSGRFGFYVTMERSIETQGRLAGAGRATVAEGDLYEYPILVRALGLFNFDIPHDGKIDAATLEFSVRRYMIHVTRMDFLSDSVSLFGSGVCDFFGENLDIVFVPRLGREGSLNPFNLPLALLATAHLEGSIVAPAARVVPLASTAETERRIIEEALRREHK
jgi:hypothetical protein